VQRLDEHQITALVVEGSLVALEDGPGRRGGRPDAKQREGGGRVVDPGAAADERKDEAEERDPSANATRRK
jgi:hypothetical protein